jgi:YVTN family beta-propeller protein
MGNGSRPLALYTNPDGSMKWIFAQLSGVNGFTVVDFATHQIIKKVDNPPITPGKQPVLAGADASHGMAITPDREVLLVDSLINSALYAYSLPDLKVIGTAELGGKGAAWITLTPDGKTAYVAEAVTNNVSVVDVKSMKEIALIPVGFVPKRNTTGMLLE